MGSVYQKNLARMNAIKGDSAALVWGTTAAHTDGVFLTCPDVSAPAVKTGKF